MLACALAIAGAARAEEPLHIGKITIVTEDVYTDAEAAKGAAYGVVNTLHVRTRASVIERMILFSEGDVYVPSRLAETERNLRKLNFIGSASVVAGEPHDGVVDVTVVTQDAWSTEPGGSVGSAGGGTSGSLSVRETNFLGLGKELTVEYASDPDRSGLGFQYEDPSLFGHYWRADLGYANNSDGKLSKFLVERPFYSFASTWSVRALAFDQNRRAASTRTEKWRACSRKPPRRMCSAPAKRSPRATRARSA
jgi:outer membrane translocation and assembly module TamA